MIREVTEADSPSMWAALRYHLGKRLNRRDERGLHQEPLHLLLVDEPVRRALEAAVQVTFDGKPGDDFPEEYADAADELWQFFVAERQESPPEKVV